MSKSPRDGIVAVPPIPPGGIGVSGAVNTPAPLLFDQHATQGQAVPGYSVPMSKKSRLFGSTHKHSERHEQRAAESEQRVGDRWTTTGVADAATTERSQCRVTPTADAAAPTPTRSPWWRWT